MLDLLRRNRNFRLLWIAQVVSYLGDWFTTVAVLGEVKDLTDSPLATTMVLVCQLLPSFLVTPWAGPLADRIDRRRILIIVSTLQAGCALAFLAIGPGRVWIAFAAMSSVAALGGFFAPASQAALANLVETRDLPTAGSIMGSTWGAMLAIGAALGGAFTVAFGRDAAFVVDAASFVVAAALIAAIRAPMQASRTTNSKQRMRPIADTAEALHRARKDPELLALLWSKAGFGLAGGVVGLLAVLATDTFHGGDGSIGLLLAGRGIGAVSGPLIARRLIVSSNIPATVKICAYASLVYGAGYLLVSVSPSLALTCLLVLIAHLGGGTQWTLSSIGLQLVTPDDIRGRVLAADMALVTLTMSISSFTAGALAEAASPRVVIGGFSILALAWGALYVAIGRRLSVVRSPPHT
ncbi:MAG: MFS transporter [Acidimicrobiia bacterium]